MSLQTPLNNQVTGTILAAGTLTAEPFDTQGYSLYGLFTNSNSINGTLMFRVHGTLDPNSGNWRPLYNGAGARVAVTAPSGQFGISSDVLTPLKGYRYFYVESTAQTTGLSLTLMLKTE
jgi:hypothetical protein